MSEPQSERWVEITVDGRRTRHPLGSGLTRVGGPGCDLEVGAMEREGGAGGDELHLWSDPPKVVAVGSASRPLLNGRAFEEATLADGDAIQWGPAVLVYGEVAKSPVLEEILEEPRPVPAPPAPPAPPVAPVAPAAPGAPVAPGERLGRRLVAGLLVEVGLADRQAARRWQEAVQRSEYDPDACARELLAASSAALDDPRLMARAGKLQRDLLMTPMGRGLRGAGRRMRSGTRNTMAYLVANLIAISIYTLVLVAIMTLVRVNYGFSFDRTIDGLLDLVTP